MKRSSREDEGSGPLGVRNPGVFFWGPGGPAKSVGGNVGGISVSGEEFVPCGLQQSYLEPN